MGGNWSTGYSDVIHIGIDIFTNPGVTRRIWITVYEKASKIGQEYFTDSNKMSTEGLSIMKLACNVIPTSTLILCFH